MLEKEKEKEKQINTKYIDSLDDEWIKKFEEEDKKYEDFYKEDNYYINLYFIYLNEENSIEKIKQEKFFMNTPNYITREEIIYLLKKNTIMDKIKYSIFSLLKYNMTLEPDDIQCYLNTQEYEDNSSFLKTIKNIDTILFEKTISSFQDLNSLFFILCEKSTTNEKGIKTLNNHKNIQTHTKKIYIHKINSRRKKGTRKN
jgi:hypothetical protein